MNVQEAKDHKKRITELTSELNKEIARACRAGMSVTACVDEMQLHTQGRMSVISCEVLAIVNHLED